MRLETAFFLMLWAVSSAFFSDKASWGHISTHLGSPSQRSQMMTFFLSDGRAMTPNSQASMHHPHPEHLSASTLMMPVVSSWLRAFRGQELTQVGSSQRRQARDVLTTVEHALLLPGADELADLAACALLGVRVDGSSFGHL
jgi:hypothetical protein